MPRAICVTHARVTRIAIMPMDQTPHEFDPDRGRKLAHGIRQAGTALAMICFTFIFLAWVGAGFTFFAAMAGKLEQRAFSFGFTAALILTPILGITGRFVDLAGEILAELMEDRIARHEADQTETDTPTHAAPAPPDPPADAD